MTQRATMFMFVLLAVFYAAMRDAVPATLSTSWKSVALQTCTQAVQEQCGKLQEECINRHIGGSDDCPWSTDYCTCLTYKCVRAAGCKMPFEN